MKQAKPTTATTKDEGAPQGAKRSAGASDVQEPNDLFDQVQAIELGARALFIHPYVKRSVTRRTPESSMEELLSLGDAIELQAVQQEFCALSAIKPSTYMGRGKVEEMASIVAALDVEVVIMNCALSPIQQRNLERELHTKVIDRTALILEIFGARAQTREGVMQVQLAHLSYQRGRLVRSWTHLERQRGGAGFMGGPGERQIEADRRALDESIGRLTKQLEKVTRTRELHRKGRQKTPYPVVALVGYTNAGKSTLFNRLTNADVFAEDQLFATLDPTMREVTLESGRQIILSDTVGFISDLPTHLVAAFRATLEEVIQADIIIHVRDISHIETAEQREDVLEILNDLGIKDYDEHEMIEIHNKIDLLDHEINSGLVADKPKETPIQFCAIDGRGEADLLQRIDDILAVGSHDLRVRVPHDQGEALSWLYRHGDVLARDDKPEGTEFQVRLTQADLGRMQKMDGIEILSSSAKQ
ncbi:MAG: GTPase HflX [Alphaproteobacteria bacterium]|nr:MAG: GTPase HflX [Alphaproteobacteria bacterium]